MNIDYLSMICQECGDNNPENFDFCRNCGKKLLKNNIDEITANDFDRRSIINVEPIILPSYIKLSLLVLILTNWIMVVISLILGLILFIYGGGNMYALLLLLFPIGFYYSAKNFSKFNSRGRKITTIWASIAAGLLTLLLFSLILSDGIWVLIGVDWIFYTIIDILFIY